MFVNIGKNLVVQSDDIVGVWVFKMQDRFGIEVVIRGRTDNLMSYFNEREERDEAWIELHKQLSGVATMIKAIT